LTDTWILDYVQSSVELAQEYLGMGQITKASTMYSQVVNTVKEGDLTDEVQVRFLLKRAELLAPEDEWDQRYKFIVT
jgi:separase